LAHDHKNRKRRKTALDRWNSPTIGKKTKNLPRMGHPVSWLNPTAGCINQALKGHGFSRAAEAA
jgi:hypothetical protein